MTMATVSRLTTQTVGGITTSSILTVNVRLPVCHLVMVRACLYDVRSTGLVHRLPHPLGAWQSGNSGPLVIIIS